jgi:hypothetical protein
MWKQAQKLVAQPGPYHHKSSIIPDHDAHAHSPRRSSLLDYANAQMHCYNDPRECAYRGCTHPRHFASPQHQLQQKPTPSPMYASNMMPTYTYTQGTRNTPGTVDDPFLVESYSGNAKPYLHKQTRSSSHDVSMPDYRSAESRALTEMSGVSYNRLDFERQVNNAAVEELVKALSPTKQEQLLKALSPPGKRSRDGSVPPENSPADTAPLRSNKGSQKVQTLYADLDNVESSVDQSPSTSRTTSNEGPLLPFSRTHFGGASPADNIQGKKERDQARKSVEQPTGDRGTPLENSGGNSKSRSPLIEALNLTRQRSNSAGSKRKRSNSKLDQVTSAEQSPAGRMKVSGLGASIFSPYHVVDDEEVAGGRRKTLPLT